MAAGWAGFENIFHCEWNPFCRQVLKHHFPNSESYEDITKTDFTKWRGKIDVITGGFPCQPFSCAGRRKGSEDDRYLWPQMLRAIEEIRPSWVIGENVAGLLSMVFPGEEIEVGVYQDTQGENHTETEIRERFIIDKICQDLEKIGYTVQPFIIPACAVGAPHRRDRIWIASNRSDTRLESVQFRWENNVHANPIDAYTNSERFENRRDNRRKRQVCCDEERDTEKDKPEWEERECGTWKNDSIIPNAESTRFKRKCKNGQEKIQSDGQSCRDIQSRWRNFPTQSPVCNRNDGLSDRLVGITFPQWRMKAIEAMGNAIVPQVAFEIFNAIKNTYHEETTNHPNQRD